MKLIKMSQQKLKNPILQWMSMGIAMLACCLVPMAAFFFLNRSWRALVDYDNKQPASNQSTSQQQLQPTIFAGAVELF
ncbi:hypothetical protein QUA46_04755 [Microcoleus sp. MON2_D6]|uniref:hypothetical protein n=1 Tax=unclassified Microcoleus TaxID=2642155 RepID=UPI002FD2B70E